VGDALLTVHRSYLKPIRALMAARLLRGAAHITGGGITDNTPRMLPKEFGVTIETTSWKILRCSRFCGGSATFRKTITGAL